MAGLANELRKKIVAIESQIAASERQTAALKKTLGVYRAVLEIETPGNQLPSAAPALQKDPIRRRRSVQAESKTGRILSRRGTASKEPKQKQRGEAQALPDERKTLLERGLIPKGPKPKGPSPIWAGARDILSEAPTAMTADEITLELKSRGHKFSGETPAREVVRAILGRKSSIFEKDDKGRFTLKEK